MSFSFCKNTGGPPQVAATACRHRSDLHGLRIPPGNPLEALKSNRLGQHSIRINAQWRMCFAWHDDGAYRVEIVDHH
jgi:plasmid maintenance system killer protein